MDWLKLFALLVAVASVQIMADGPKKKIRIHLPQKVKHIHHHKKIYITNHAATSQYAPAYMPGGDGAVALPTNVALPAVTNILPLNSVELIDDNQHRLHGVSPAASKLLPLYHARGYYGPTTTELEEDYDIAPPPDTLDSYLPAGYSSSVTASPNRLPKKVKIVKFNDQPRKKVVRKGKAKRVVVRNRPQPPPPADEEVPVTNFHEQFYADLDSSGIIRKIKKPPRVEKIVDGDTEHIHAYSEEHIHKLVFDDPPKYNSVVGVDHMSSMSAINPARPIIPYKNSQTLIAIPSDSFSNLAGVGPLAAPAQIEYPAYNRDVTHDHIFHDHGEIPADIDITKDGLSLPPKVSYNSKGLRISGGHHKRQKNKYGQRLKKINKPHPTDFSYYESIYTPNRPKKTHRQTFPFLDETESNLEDYRTINNVRYKEPGIVKPRNLVPTYYAKPGLEYRPQQDNAAAPFSVSSTVVHDYKPKAYGSGSSSLPRYKDPFVNFKDNYANNFEYDTYASSSNIYTTEDKNENSVYALPDKNSKKKSISTQNISFGGQDHLTYVDHLEESNLSDDDTPTALDFDQFDQSQLPISPTPTPFTIKESSPMHPYYTVMAVKAMQDQPSMPAASNNNYQYAEAPTPTTTPVTPSLASTTNSSPQSSPVHNNIQSTSAPVVEQIEFITETKHSKRFKEPNKNFNGSNGDAELKERHVLKEVEIPIDHRVRSLHTPDQMQLDHHNQLTGRTKLKYGDKI